MNILIISDSFKESLTSREAAASIHKGFLAATDASPGTSSISVTALPVSDGGDGFLEAVEAAFSLRGVPFESRRTTVFDPLLRPISARYILQKENPTAFIEMAQASGLHLLAPNERDPTQTSSFGTGQLIADAIDSGARTVIVGIGGSATHDCGIGMASALGTRFFDAQGRPLLHPRGKHLSQVDRIELDPKASCFTISAINDVTNPLLGPHGAAHTYALQKGADQEQVVWLEAAATKFGELVESSSAPGKGTGMKEAPGSGAAGGLGFGLKVFCDADFIEGSKFVSDLYQLDTRLHEGDFDLIVTGEGKLDRQTEQGKWVSHIQGLAETAQVPVVAFCGVCELKLHHGRTASGMHVVAIHDPVKRTREASIDQAASLLESAAESWFAMFQNESR